MLEQYERINFKDHIVDPESGQVIQEGTPLSENQFNHMEDGIAGVTARTVEQDAVLEEIETNVVAEVQAVKDFLSTLTTASYAVCPYANREEIKSSRAWVCPEGVTKLDAVLVGGGGGGVIGDSNGSSGGGGGYFKVVKNIAVTPGTSYPIVVGTGGSAGTASTVGGTGGTTSAFGSTAAGGLGGALRNDVNGSNGGSGGATPALVVGSLAGGSYGQNAPTAGIISMNSTPTAQQGMGSGILTIDPYTGIPYCGGGGGTKGFGSFVASPGGVGGGGRSGCTYSAATHAESGKANTGGGGGAGISYSDKTARAGAGGSGIVIIYY
ncbi:hypothetical protein LJC32_02645 [Oscillospiraceae bacterium OttesenSCG-928-F05]|nr:hypothetical protein [Oscillospiraceae bacterium OttesenSCG-928-F05]